MRLNKFHAWIVHLEKRLNPWVVQHAIRVLLGKRVQVVMIVLKVNFDWVRIKMLRFVTIALKDGTKMSKVKGRAFHAYQELIKKILDQLRVQLVKKDSTKIWLEMIPVWNVM